VTRHSVFSSNHGVTSKWQITNGVHNTFCVTPHILYQVTMTCSQQSHCDCVKYSNPKTKNTVKYGLHESVVAKYSCYMLYKKVDFNAASDLKWLQCYSVWQRYCNLSWKGHKAITRELQWLPHTYSVGCIH